MSANSSIHNSDVIIAWLNDDGTGHFSDRHNGILFDTKSNWNMLHSSRVNNVTIFKFTRKIYLCDKTEDLDIKPEGNHVLFTWAPLGSEINFNNKNTKSLFFILSNIENKV